MLLLANGVVACVSSHSRSYNLRFASVRDSLINFILTFILFFIPVQIFN